MIYSKILPVVEAHSDIVNIQQVRLHAMETFLVFAGCVQRDERITQ